MLTRKPALATAVLVAAVLSGCGPTAPDEPLDGVWTGLIRGDRWRITFRLGNAGSVVTGTGSSTFFSVTQTGDVTGSYFHPDVRLSWTLVYPDETLTLSYVGQRSNVDLISGTLTGGGNTDYLVLNRTSRE